MIDWEQIAKMNGLSPEEFRKEIFTVAACVGAMQLDEQETDNRTMLKFSCSDDVGKIEVIIRRAPEEKQKCNK